MTFKQVSILDEVSITPILSKICLDLFWVCIFSEALGIDNS